MSKLERWKFLMPLTMAVLFLAAMASGAWAAVQWNTSTVGLKVVADVGSITPTNRTLNLGIMGLDELGNVDIYGGSGGSVIIAGVTSLLGVPAGAGATPGAAAGGTFAAATRYYTLTQGNGLANITYPADASGTDTVTVVLYERRLDEGGNAMTRKIAQKVLTVPVEAAAPSAGILNIESFTKAATDGNGVTNIGPAAPASEAVDSGLAAGAAAMTAGVAGGTFQVCAYRITSARAYVPDTNAYGTVTLTLTGYNKAAVDGNRAQSTDTYTFTGTMAKGVANIVVDSTITKAGRYTAVATMDSLTSIPNKVSDNVVTTDFIDILAADQITSVSLSVDRSVVSNTAAADVAAAAGTDGFSFDPTFTVALLDPYGNKIRSVWSTGATVKVTDANFKIADFNIAIPAAANSASLLVDSSAFTQGLASLTASVPANSLIAASAPVSLKIVANTAQLITNADGTNNPVGGLAAVTAGTVLTNFFQVGTDDGSGAGTAGDGLPNGTELNNLVATDSIKITSLSPGADGTKESITVAVKDNNPDAVDALFTKVLTNANWLAKGFMIEDPSGSHAGLKYIPETGSAFAVNPSSPNKAYVKNAAGAQVTEITPVVNANGSFTATINGARVSMADSYGNSNPQGTLTITTTKGVATGTITPPGNAATAVVLTYPAGTTGEDALTFNFTQPGVSGVNDGNGVKVVFPTVTTLDHFDTYTGETTLPINALVPLTVIPRTASGSGYTVADGYFVDYDTTGLTLQTAGGGAFPSGSNVGANTGRAVFRVMAKTTPGSYNVTIRDASGTITKVVTFDVRQYTVPLSLSDSAVTVDVGSTANVTISGGASPYTVASADTSIATAVVAGTTVTITGVAAGGPVNVTVTDANGDTATVAVTVQQAVTPQPLPSGQNVNELTGSQIANAPVNLGSVVTGGNQMELAVNFPAYAAAVDEYVAIQIPGGTLFFLGHDGNLTTNMVAYAKGVTAAQKVTVYKAFDVCNPFGQATVPTGQWTVYSLVSPANGGHLSSVVTYDLPYYTFTVGNCQ